MTMDALLPAPGGICLAYHVASFSTLVVNDRKYRHSSFGAMAIIAHDGEGPIFHVTLHGHIPLGRPKESAGTRDTHRTNTLLSNLF